MTGEVIVQDGAAGFVEFATGLSLSAGVHTQVHATNTIASKFTTPEENYPEFDILLVASGNTPTAGKVIEVFFRPKADGSTESPAPDADYAPHRVGGVQINDALSGYYEFGLANLDKNGTLYLKSNETTTTLTVAVYVRMRSHNAAA